MNRVLISIFAVLLVTNKGFTTETPAESSPQWVAHVSSPGPDYPVIGYSLFDRLFLKNTRGNREYVIPFPFDALIANLEKRVDNSKRSSVPHGLIPIGRSLQREAAAPNYFQHPRSVITVVGEPITVLGQNAPVMNYRLFIAYQEKAKQLEIISYNELAGRFEFQIVENYQSNAIPSVTQASRTLCLSCHQNAGPIFAASPWSESNFNPAVAIRLTRAQPAKFESVATTISDGAEAIDLATGRANYLAAAQLIWQSGCEGILAKNNNFRCRAAILQALLQYRLSGNIAFDTDSTEYQLDFVSALRNNWNIQWPGGLMLASARIPDRDPFNPQLSEASQNPLSMRPAHAFWLKPDEAFLKGIVYRIAGFLTEADIRRLDQHLHKIASTVNIESEHYRAICKLDNNMTNLPPVTYRFECINQSSPQSITATIEIEHQNDGLVSVSAMSLSLPDSSLIWQPTVANFNLIVTGANKRLNAKLSGAQGGLSARMQNGNRISEMNLNWLQGNPNSGPPQSFNMELIVLSDFRIVQDAISQMVFETMAGRSQSLTSQPVRQQAIISELEKILGMEVLKW